MSIYITGDIHGYPERLSNANFLAGKQLTKEDYVIILGDFGLIWDYKEESKYEKYWLDWLDERPFTTLFIDGNHENYDRLIEYPEEYWNGGWVQKIRPSVIHLMRGEIFNIGGKTIFAMGGAASHDISDGILKIDDPRIKQWSKDPFKMFRVNHVSWWEQEVPSISERIHAVENLEKAHLTVDFVLSHEGPASTIALLGGGFYKPDEYSKWLEELRAKITYDKWYFGHYHEDKYVTNNEICKYETINQIA